MLVPPAL